MTNLTIDQVKSYHLDAKTTQLKAALVVSRAAAELLRADVDALLGAEFAGYGFVRDDSGEPISDEGDLYLSDQEDLARRWYARRDEIIEGAGWTIPEIFRGEGFCPALVAESEVIAAENALLDHAREWFGFPEILGLEDRRRAIELFSANS